MLRKVTSVICVLCILLTSFAIATPVYAETTAVRARKMVSVVYDDSGSMEGDRWVYANYATQALIALLDESDELYITYMSEPDKAYKKSLKNIENTIDDMGNWSQSSGTPGESIDTAKKALDNISEKDESVQFWLVVMTDGDITFDSGTTTQSKLDSYKGDKMSNGSALNVVYLRMGVSSVDIQDDKSNGLYEFKAENDKDIGPAIFDMASLVSGRIDVENLKQIDDKTISFSSKLPAYSFSFLVHQSHAKVESVTSNELSLKIDRNVGLNAKDPFGETTLTQYGSAGMASLKNSSGVYQVLQSGTYIVKFSESVNIKDLLVQYEPAIGLKMDVFKDNNVVDDTDKLSLDDEIGVCIKPVISGTDTEIPMEHFPNGTTWSIEYIVDGNVVDSASGTELNAVKLKKGENVIRGYLQLPGYSPLVVEVVFDITEIIYNFGIDVEQPSPLSYLRGNIEDGSEQGDEVKFYVTNDGVPLSAEAIKDLDIDLIVTDVNCDDSNITGFWNRLGKWKVNCTIQQNDDGSFTLVPKKYVVFTAFLILAGDYTVDVALSVDESITAQGEFSVIPMPSDWYDLIKLTISLLLLAYIFHLIFKPKFHGETVNYDMYKMLEDGGGVSQRAFDCKDLKLTTGLFKISRASRCKFHDLEIVAESGRVIIVTDKSIAKTVYAYGSDSSSPTQRLSRIVKNLSVTEQDNGESVATDLALSGTNEQQRLYFKTSKTDRYIWCMWLS